MLSSGERVQGEAVLVQFETTAGLMMRQLRWSDELRPSGRTIELPLVDPLQPQG